LQHHILPRLGRLKLTKLTKPLIVNFKNQLLAEHSQSLTAQVMTSLKGLIGVAQEGDGLISQNVALGVTVKKSERHEERAKIPSKEELRVLLATMNEAWPATAPWKAFFVTSIFTGLRPAELRGLIWKHVDLKQCVITVAQRADYHNVIGFPKSKAGRRTVPLAPMVINALRQWKLASRHRTEDADLVFPAGNGGALAQSTMWGTWQRLLAAAGMEPKAYRTYDMRHAAISLLIEQGLTPKKIQAIAGHSKISTTLDIYGHLWQTPEDDAAAMAEVEARLLRGL
jgi:integrase